MNSDYGDSLIVIFTCLFLGGFIFFLGLFVGRVQGSIEERNHIYQEAIDAGVGEYYLDSDLNKRFMFFCDKCVKEV